MAVDGTDGDDPVGLGFEGAPVLERIGDIGVGQGGPTGGDRPILVDGTAKGFRVGDVIGELEPVSGECPVVLGGIQAAGEPQHLEVVETHDVVGPGFQLGEGRKDGNYWQHHEAETCEHQEDGDRLLHARRFSGGSRAGGGIGGTRQVGRLHRREVIAGRTISKS